MHGHRELNSLVVRGGHPHCEASIRNKRANSEVKNVSLHGFESIRSLGRDVVGSTEDIVSHGQTVSKEMKIRTSN